MVAHATTSPLPLLSPEDKRLLRIYFRVGQSIQALADELISIQAIHRADSPHSSLPTPHSPLPDEFDLAIWATSDPIAPHINYRKQELSDARREEALKELTSITKHSDSPLERRRAATTLLRMLQNPRTAVRGLSDPRPPAAPPLFPSSPSGGGAAVLRGGGGSVSTPPTHSPSRNTPEVSPLAHDANSSSPSPHPHPSAANSAPHLGSSGPSVASSPPDSAAPALLRLTLYAIMSPKDLTHRAALEPHLAPQATINHEPILNLESQLSAISPKFEVTELVPDDSQIQLFPGPPESRTSICTLYQVGRNNRYHITLTRAASGSWLVSAINPIKDTS